jgi:hypothetical protein
MSSIAMEEIKALRGVLAKPVAAVVGGAKVI